MSVFKRLGQILKSEIRDAIEGKKKNEGGESFHSHRADQAQDDETFSPASSSGENQKELEYYANLELSPGAKFEDVKSAYRRLLKAYHPDLHANDAEKAEVAEEITAKLNEAYEYFKNKYQS